jgi:hypothetical protein
VRQKFNHTQAQKEHSLMTSALSNGRMVDKENAKRKKNEENERIRGKINF